MKYKYSGKVTVKIYGIGNIEPGQEFETDIEINHPLIKKVEQKTKKPNTKRREK